MNSIRKEKIEFISTDNTTVLRGVLAYPEKIKAVLIIAHGMAEHIDRYDDFSEYMAQNGFAVIMYNHVGHKNSVASDNDLGFIASYNGENILIGDIIKAYDIITNKYPDLPVFLMGHSMGSFIVRNAAITLNNRLSGLIISGTGGPNPLIGIGLCLINNCVRKNGPKSYNSLVQKMAFGSYNSTFEGRTAYDWLSRDNDIVDKYVEDKYCGFEFTVSAMGDLMRLIKKANSKSAYALSNKNLPILIFSGQNDPVGDYSKGVTKVYEAYVKAGFNDVNLKIYEGARHETLNETNKLEVYDFVKEWINKRI